MREVRLPFGEDTRLTLTGRCKIPLSPLYTEFPAEPRKQMKRLALARHEEAIYSWDKYESERKVADGFPPLRKPILPDIPKHHGDSTAWPGSIALSWFSCNFNEEQRSLLWRLKKEAMIKMVEWGLYIRFWPEGCYLFRKEPHTYGSGTLKEDETIERTWKFMRGQGGGFLPDPEGVTWKFLGGLIGIERHPL